MKYEVSKNTTEHTCDWCNSRVIAGYVIHEKSLDLTYHSCRKHLNEQFTSEEVVMTNK